MYVEARKKFVEWLRCQLIGPAGEGALRMSPLDRYPTGVLHPVEPHVSGIDPASAGHEEPEPTLLDDQDDSTHTDDESEDLALAGPARRRRYVPPSSVGFSCYVRGDVRLCVTASAATYGGTEERGEGGRFRIREYTRTELPDTSVTWSRPVAPSGADETIWGGHAGIDIRARPHRSGCILTVTLCNREALDPEAPPRERTRDRVGKSLFEARLECAIESGELVEYPRVDPSLLSKEEQEIELQYREQRIYAVGHGAAANWDVRPDCEARIWSEFMPEAEVPMMTVNTGGDDAVLHLARLAEAPMLDELDRFVVGYADWIAEQKRTASELRSTGEQVAANRICGRMSVALDRMRACVEDASRRPALSGVVPIGESGDARPDAKGRSRCRQGDRAGRLPLAALSVGLSAHGHGVRDPGRRRVSRRAGSHLVSHRRRQDRGVPGSDCVS